MGEIDQPYSRLLRNEFHFVCESDVSYVAHEFLAVDNHPYWRSEFLALLSVTASPTSLMLISIMRQGAFRKD